MMGSLDGLRVVEIADQISGPYCGKLLVELGADVTKIEAPEGDPLRQWGPFPGGEPDPDRSGLFEYLNAGKRGAVLDLTRDSDVATARRLIADADVLIDGSAPGTLAALQPADSRLAPLRLARAERCGRTSQAGRRGSSLCTTMSA